MSSDSTVLVKGLAGQSEKELRDFFSFCGKIANLKQTSDDSAELQFEKPSAARTALLLDGTQLGKSTVSVTSAASFNDAAGSGSNEHHDEQDGHVPQELKPRSRILAEYLASGYKVADSTLSKAIELDNKHGITNRFQTYLQQVDQKTQATSRAAQADQKFGVTKGLTNAWLGLNSYFDAAKNTEQGRKIHKYYQTGFANANDIHQEALRLSGLKDKQAQSQSQGSDGTYKAETVGKDGEKTLTHCGCGGVDGVCGCKPGECTCAGCAKKDSTTSATTSQTATGQADTIAASANVAPLGEKQ